MDDDIRKVHRVAAAMAVSNLGHLGFSIPVSRVTNWVPPKNPLYSSARGEVEDIAGSLMENDEHEALFAAEADGWVEGIIAAGSLEAFANQFPHHKEWLDVILNWEFK